LEIRCICVLTIFRFEGCPDASEKPAAYSFVDKAGIEVIRGKILSKYFIHQLMQK
jgi:hypothetical protein